MDTELKIFIERVKEKTGIDVKIYADENQTAIDPAAFSEQDPEGIISDTENSRTLFSVNTKTKKYAAEIVGAGDVERTYAKLISALGDNYFFKDNELKRSEFYKSVLFGEISYSQYRRYMHKFRIEDAPCFAMIIAFDKEHAAEINELLLSYGGEKNDFILPIDETQFAFIKFSDEESVEYQSSAEYAEFLSQTVFEEIGVNVAVFIGGTVESAYDLNSSYSQATAAYRMAKGLNVNSGVHSYKDYILITILEDLPKYKQNEYMSVLMDNAAKEIFSDKEMTDTAEEFLNSNLNISETSRKLYLHRNTLMYRLDKIERATGLNIRKFSDAVTFRLITMLSKLVK